MFFNNLKDNLQEAKQYLYRGFMCGVYYRLSLLVTSFLCMAQYIVLGQTMQGQLMDVDDNKPVDNVIISNIFTDVNSKSDKEGKFVISVAAGQLIEFKKDGYQVIRVRIPQGKLAAYCKVGMKKYDAAIPKFENSASPDYKSDSIKYAQLYKHELELPQMTTVQVLKHPFSAMSKRNQQIWAFQKEFTWYQEQKYIDYVFSDKLITSITGLTGDSLQIYRQLFRPTYEQIRSLGEYNFLMYVKRTVSAYRKRGIRAKMPGTRSTR